MITTRSATVMSLILTVVLLGPACAPAPIVDRGYQIVFRDEFDGTQLGPVWQVTPYGNPLPPTVRDGVLTLRSQAANDYAWGIVGTTGPRAGDGSGYPYAEAWERGYFEARIRYSDNRWTWAAFWLFGMAKVNAWPGEDCSELNAEWDIMENGIENVDGSRPARNWSFTALHRNTVDGTPDGYCGIRDVQRTHGQHHPDKDLSDWHVWSGHWTETEMCTYLDGVELSCMEPYDSTDQPMHLVFTIDNLPRCIDCPPRPSELIMQVDWVRVWQ